jgi:HAD superfamily hydrolase (TIGR01509 family)
MLKAVIFDLDGLLVDSTPVHWEANRLFIKSFGKIYLTPTSGREGMRIIDIVREYKDIYDLPGEVDELYEKRQVIFYKLAYEKISLVPGALELIRKLEQRKLKFALATSGDRYYVNLLFKKFPELKSAFTVVITSEDVHKGKPDPEVYTKTLRKLGVTGADAVVLEDAVNGIASAKAAGIQVICVPNKNYPDADYSQADKLFSSLSLVESAIP